jgi:hypothetical protein
MMKLFGGILTVALVAILIFLFLGSTVVRFDLVTVKPAFWLFGLGIVFLMGGGWLTSADVPGGSFFAALGTGMLLLGGYKTLWPSTSAASAHAQMVADSEGAIALNAAVAPRQIPCDSSTQPRPKFFDSVTGAPLIWVALEKSTGRFECYNRPGFHSVTREALIAVDAKLALVILAQEPVVATPVVVAPAPQPVPTVLPSPIPTPSLRELGTSYIPGWPFPDSSPTPAPIK